MKGIILAGGSATRLYPSTISVSKHLLTVYDKPMVYYPLSILMLAGIKEILIISTESALPLYKNLLGNGNQLGIEIKYQAQDKPKGIADAFVIGKDFIANENVCLILGDNIFYGHGMLEQLVEATNLTRGATIFVYHVKDPERYGVAEISGSGKKVISIEEKPKVPKSNYAITGLYFFDNSVVERAKNVQPSARGELEITSILQSYLDDEILSTEMLGRGIAWLDTGTHESLLEASNFISAIENRQGLKIACLEEIAYNLGYINSKQLENLISLMPNSDYKRYITNLFINA